MPTTPTNQNMFGASPGHPRNILEDRHARISLDRLISFQYTWKYQDGIFDGVVWVKPDIDQVFRGHHDFTPSPYWYSCVAENNGDQYGYLDDDGYTVVHSNNSSHGMKMYDNWMHRSWYRKFVLYEMNADNMDRVMAGFCLKSVLCQTSLVVDHASGVVNHMNPRSSEANTSDKIKTALGGKNCADMLNRLPWSHEEYFAAGFHTNKVEGWFQR